jgi:RNA polymerase sigma factor (sigma-70 family)
VRRGDSSAFRVLYDRHSRELLSFCRYMLGSREDAEDAVQSTFASAYRALLADERSVALRPWLFAIARNASLSILRQRRPSIEVAQAPALREDPSAQLEQREDLRQLLETLLELPERQRAALVLTELHGLSQSEIGAMLGVRAEQVKSYVYQARSSLISERRARGVECQDIREELATARGAALLRGRLRRHLRSCAGCRQYARERSRQRGQLAALLPAGPLLALRRRALEAVSSRTPGSGGGLSAAGAEASVAGTATGLAGGGAKVLAAKVLAAVACLGAGAGAATLALGVPITLPAHPAPRSSPDRSVSLKPASVAAARVRSSVDGNSTRGGDPQAGGALTHLDVRGAQPPVSVIQQSSPAYQNSRGPTTAAEAPSTKAAPATRGESVAGVGEDEGVKAPAEGKREKAVAEGKREKALTEGKREKAVAEGKREKAVAEGKREKTVAEGKREKAGGESKRKQASGKGKRKRDHGEGVSEEAHGEGASEEPQGEGGSEESHGDEESHGEEAHGEGASEGASG